LDIEAEWDKLYTCNSCEHYSRNQGQCYRHAPVEVAANHHKCHEYSISLDSYYVFYRELQRIQKLHATQTKKLGQLRRKLKKKEQ